MKTSTKKSLGILSVFTFLWFSLDYLSKAWVLSSYFFRPFVFIDDFFYFTYQQNTGVAFGIPLPQWFQLIATVVILGMLLFFAFRYIFISNRYRFSKLLLLGIVFGGAFGNALDRFLRGYVVDFIYLYPIPVFNVADIGITVGLILLFFLVITESDKTQH